MRIAIVGAGVSGLGAAWLLNPYHDVTLFEAEPRLGGHANTVEIDHGGRAMAVDTGFIVYNDHNYPLLSRLFRHLGVETSVSDMSFAASIGDGEIEYSGSNARVLFSQKRNLARPAFLRMLADIARFNIDARRFVRRERNVDMEVGEFLDRGRYGDGFRRWYLLPMAAAIWSAPLSAIYRFPACSLLAFFDNHGLLNLGERPKWRTVKGGSKTYVDKLAAGLSHRARPGHPVSIVRRVPGGVEVGSWAGDRQLFDQVVLACHADQALHVLADATRGEQAALATFSYQTNRAILHADTNLMPRRRGVWSSWNYMAAGTASDEARLSVTYWMNRLQNLDPGRPLFVSLNPLKEPDPALTFGEWHYEHPVFDAAGLEAQRKVQELQGRDRVWFAGAWLGHGFHEDGLRSGFDVARRLGAVPPWESVPVRRLDTSIGLPDRATALPV